MSIDYYFGHTREWRIVCFSQFWLILALNLIWVFAFLFVLSGVASREMFKFNPKNISAKFIYLFYVISFSVITFFYVYITFSRQWYTKTMVGLFWPIA